MKRSHIAILAVVVIGLNIVSFFYLNRTRPVEPEVPAISCAQQKMIPGEPALRRAVSAYVEKERAWRQNEYVLCQRPASMTGLPEFWVFYAKDDLANPTQAGQSFLVTVDPRTNTVQPLQFQ